ncbi:MAG: flagellar motor protein MotB [Desulfobacteraceae bacterium]|nr:flagellar motor protein MotB [Desulfobacteraceae bacterium]
MAVNNKKQRRPENTENKSSGNWQIVYTGFVLILLCFFIMLSSFSTLENAKIMRFVRSFSDAVNVYSGGLNVKAGDQSQSALPETIPNKSNMAILLENIATISHNIGLTEAELTITEKGVVMTLPDTALFGSGVANINSDAARTLKKVAYIINRTTEAVRIEGHTDNRPIRNWKYSSNWELSVTRAVNVLRYFIETEGIDSQRLSAVGFGEFQSVAPNTTKDNRAKNRRVEIVFLQA